MKTDAVVNVGIGQVEIQQIEMPPPGPGEVQVRTDYSCISSGTEGWILKNEFTWSPTPYPCVPGYQRTGTVTAIGEGVTSWQVGDYVMALSGAWEGPVASMWGAHLALANTPEQHIFHLPEGIDPIAASAGVVAQVGYNAANRATALRGAWALVYGDGIIGQCAAQAARARGYRVILIGHRAERLALGKQGGAELCIDNHTQDVVETVRAHTGKQTVEVVLDTVQQVAAQKEYLSLLEAVHGQIVYSGFTPGTAWADMGLLQQQELTTHFVAGWTRERMEATFALMASGQMNIKPLMTHIVPYTQAPVMYRMILEKSEPFLGIIFDWTKQ